MEEGDSIGVCVEECGVCFFVFESDLFGGVCVFVEGVSLWYSSVAFVDGGGAVGCSYGYGESWFVGGGGVGVGVECGDTSSGFRRVVVIEAEGELFFLFGYIDRAVLVSGDDEVVMCLDGGDVDIEVQHVGHPFVLCGRVCSVRDVWCGCQVWFVFVIIRSRIV